MDRFLGEFVAAIGLSKPCGVNGWCPPSFPYEDLNEVAYGHGCWACYPLVEWQPSAERNSSRGEPSTSCKSFIAKGTDSSSIAGRIGHFLQVAPIESAAARIIFRLARISARGTPDRTLTTSGAFGSPSADRAFVGKLTPHSA